MRTLRTIFATLVLSLAVIGPVLGVDEPTIERGVTLDKNAAAEKGDRTPVLQYALAATVTLTVLVVVCMPSRKAQ
jgi:hypothetical protein